MPQTRGATYVYLTYLEPFLKKYESQIDSSAASAKASALTFIQERLRALWRHVSTSISQQQDAQMHPISQLNTSNPPTQSHPATGTAQLLESFWRTYGSNVVATGAALIQQSAAAANAASQRAQAQRANHSPNERRRQLEAELASLPPVTMPQNTQAAYSTSRASSASDINSEMRERALSASKFEEIAVPEGYEDDDTVGPSYGTKTRPNPSKRTSWFGWGSGSGSERLKDD
jgi:receptor expression-enhancing protein 1/2/3/4